MEYYDTPGSNYYYCNDYQPGECFFLAAIFGLLGLILGECMRRHLPPMKMMFYGSIGAVIALILNIVLSFWVLGMNPIDMMFSSFHESLGQLAMYYREHGMSEVEIKKIVAEYEELLRMMKIIMPGAFLLCAPLMAFVNYMDAKKILTKLGETFEAFPPFNMLTIPGWVLWPYGLSLLAVTYYYQTDQRLDVSFICKYSDCMRLFVCISGYRFIILVYR